jgi:hypothetical protein
MGMGDLLQNRTEDSTTANMSEVMRQLSIIGTDMQRVVDDNKLLATSHLGMQKRLEEMSNSDGVGTGAGSGKLDILAALSALSAPTLHDQPISMFNGARVSKKVTVSAKNREFVNLEDFVPSTEPNSNLESTLDEKMGKLIFKSKHSKRTVDNLLMWTTAWCAYESLIMEVDPSMYPILTNYRLYIQRKEALHTWPAVTAYDQRFRVKLSITRSWQFDKVDNEIHMDVFSSETLRPNPKACFRCRSLDHMIKDCFLSEDVSEVKKGTRRQTQSNNTDSSFNFKGSSAHPANGVYNPSNQVCRDFNLGRCFRSPCQRKHVCTGCGGSEPLFRCVRCQTNSSGNTFNTAQGGVGQAPGVSPR